MSTADSVRTIRAPQPQRPPLPDIYNDPDQESSWRARAEDLWEGTTRTFERLASRTRWRNDRSPSLSRNSSTGDVHTGPSLAVSTAFAAGSIATPDQLMSPVEVQSPKVTSPIEVQGRRQSRMLGESSDAAYSQAQEMNQRRMIQESRAKQEAEIQQQTEPSNNECPPSPDDITFLEKQRFNDSIQAAPSASTIASSVEFNDNSSHNMSNPSFGIPSNASSPPAEGWLSTECKDVPKDEPDFMRTADTVTERPVATGKALEERVEEDDDDSEDEGMTMGPSKR